MTDTVKRIKVRCEIDLTIIPEGYDGSHGLVLSFDPETEVITAKGQYTGPRSKVAENIGQIMTRSLADLAEFKLRKDAA